MEGNKTEPLKGKRLYTYWSEICEDKEEVYSNNPACVFDIEDVKSAVRGLIKELKIEREVAEHEHKNDIDRRDYFLGLIHGLNSAESKIKKWFADVFEDERK